jgi:hypothetical protein
MTDYLRNHESTTADSSGNVQVQVPVLWKALIEGLAPVWPTQGRTVLEGKVMGDVWKCDALEKEGGLTGSDALVPFHKLSQWLCYSIMEPMEQTLGWKFVGGEDQTGLPEYRNGGLLIDTGVLVPKPSLLAASKGSSSELPLLEPSHPAVVEWRAMTVIILDRIAAGIRSKMSLTPDQLNLKQVLESATWKGGREIAKEKRPEKNGCPPIVSKETALLRTRLIICSAEHRQRWYCLLKWPSSCTFHSLSRAANLDENLPWPANFKLYAKISPHHHSFPYNLQQEE